MAKPILNIDLSGPAGNIFVVVGKAQALLSKEAGEEMWALVQETHSYKDALDVISGYVYIADHSLTYIAPSDE